MTPPLAARVRELASQRVPFVHATVVRAQVPTSAHAGDDAVVLADGSIEGFVGGQCAESSVRTAALGTLVDGQTLLLRVLPEGDVQFPESPGAKVVVNSCLSGGALEIFLQPVIPPPLVDVIGSTPVADAVVAVARLLGYEIARTRPASLTDGAAAVIIASHGRDEIESIRAALDGGVRYIALLASRRRGASVLDELELTAAERGRISTPAGLDIGARTAAEVAVSIVAELIGELRGGRFAGLTHRDQADHVHPSERPNSQMAAPVEALVQVLDPVCGMTVIVLPDTPHLTVGDEEFWFCSEHCARTRAGTVGQ